MTTIEVIPVPPQAIGDHFFSPAVMDAIKPRLHIAYLSTEAPKVTHTFIRREILKLERRDHSILALEQNEKGSN